MQGTANNDAASLRSWRNIVAREAMAAEPPILAASPREASGEAARFRLSENLGFLNAAQFFHLVKFN